MKIAVFSTKPYDRSSFDHANQAHGFDLSFIEPRLDAQTAILAAGATAACIFVNDRADAVALERLAEHGVRLLLLRCAGFNNVDLPSARRLGMATARVPAYSPHAVAEHTVALMLALNRKLHRAYNRVREGNFALDGLMGFDMYGKTAGVIGAGTIGANVVRILIGLGCRVLVHDPAPEPAIRLGATLAPLSELLAESDIVTLHCPLVPATRHVIDAAALGTMKPGAMLINTGRGALIDTSAAIGALKTGHLGALGLDVYEEEAELFFEDLSSTILQDDVFARLLTFPNVLVTGHQGFFTHEAIAAIARTTLENAADFAGGINPRHAL